MSPMSSPSSPPSSSNEFLDGLKFGQKVYFEAKPNGGSSSSSGITTKKGNQQPPRCQVEGCKVDLSGAKAYYSRHKVCCMHSKSPIVVVSGLEQRFCQQCSRSHVLSLTILLLFIIWYFKYFKKFFFCFSLFCFFFISVFFLL